MNAQDEAAEIDAERAAKAAELVRSKLQQQPSVGRIVIYKDHTGEEMPAIITRVSADTVMLVAFRPGYDVPTCRINVKHGDEIRQWSWPPRI